jgi:hypothetical protein
MGMDTYPDSKALESRAIVKVKFNAITSARMQDVELASRLDAKRLLATLVKCPTMERDI